MDFFANPNGSLEAQRALAARYITWAHLEDEWHKSGEGKPLSFIDESGHFDEFQKFVRAVEAGEID